MTTTHYIKLLPRDKRQHDFLFTEGLNTLTLPYNPLCDRGCLSFCHVDNSWMYITDLYEAAADIAWVATVTLCDDSRVDHAANKSKTDKFLLGPFKPILQFLLEIPRISSTAAFLMSRVPDATEKECETLVAKSPFLIQYVRNQTRPLCLLAVQLNPDTIQCVQQQTDDLCLLAVNAKGATLQYIQSQAQTVDICRAAIRQNPAAKQFVDKQFRREVC